MVPKTETEIDKIEQNVADDIFNNIKDDYDDDDNEPPLYSQISNEIDRDRIEESKEYVKTQMQIRSWYFETIDNIDEENKNELLKSVVDPLDRQYVNDDITPSDYTRYTNNEINEEVTVTDIKTEPEPIIIEEAPVTLTEILTGQNEVEDI